MLACPNSLAVCFFRGLFWRSCINIVSLSLVNVVHVINLLPLELHYENWPKGNSTAQHNNNNNMTRKNCGCRSNGNSSLSRSSGSTSNSNGNKDHIRTSFSCFFSPALTHIQIFFLCCIKFVIAYIFFQSSLNLLSVNICSLHSINNNNGRKKQIYNKIYHSEIHYFFFYHDTKALYSNK